MEIIKRIDDAYEFVLVLVIVIILCVAFAWYYMKEDVVFKYHVDLKDYNDEAEEWLRAKRVWFFSDGRQFKFMRKNDATMFKITWG